jgi:hypothetical protein
MLTWVPLLKEEMIWTFLFEMELLSLLSFPYWVIYNTVYRLKKLNLSL